MQEKDAVSIEYFDNEKRFADLINGYIFCGRTVVEPGNIRKINRVVAKTWKNAGSLRAKTLIRDLVREINVGARDGCRQCQLWETAP